MFYFQGKPLVPSSRLERLKYKLLWEAYEANWFCRYKDARRNLIQLARIITAEHEDENNRKLEEGEQISESTN